MTSDMSGLARFSKGTSSSEIVYTSPEVAEKYYDVHHALWHHADESTRDVYRAVHRSAARIFERTSRMALGGVDPLLYTGVFIDLISDDLVLVAIVDTATLVSKTYLYLDYPQVDFDQLD